jgi:cell division septum initiation protein DivIVA
VGQERDLERDNVDVHAKLAELRQMVEEARSMPMSASAVVNRSELLDLVSAVEAAVDEAFTDARRVLADREAVVEEGRNEAELIVADARNQREAMVSDTEVYRLAKREADEVLANARAEADALHKETDEYVDAKLANFEITLERTIDAVRRGRERLAGRTDLDSLTRDEADKIRLPEHLEG